MNTSYVVKRSGFVANKVSEFKKLRGVPTAQDEALGDASGSDVDNSTSDRM